MTPIGRLFGFMRRKAPAPGARAVEGPDADLERFFTDALEARARFESLVGSERLVKKIVAIYGVGAVGKSSLLRMYRLYCRRTGVAVALVGGEETPSPVDLLDRWAADLGGGGVEMSRFGDSLRHYREIQARVDAEARRAGQAEADAAHKLADAALKDGLKVLAAAVPGGALLEAVGGEAASAFLNLLRAKLSKPDFDLYVDPTERLTEDFIADLARASGPRRVVLMLDTYEQVTALSRWLMDVVQGLPDNVVMVIAGRQLPDWDRHWPGWVGATELIELREMSDADLESLVERSYRLYGTDEPSTELIAAIVRFARGLPLAATTLVRLSVVHGIQDLAPGDPRAVADLAERLLEGVPGDMRPAFEAAAILRYFHADSLASLLDAPSHGDVEAVYGELRRWPFIRTRRGGLAVHETMREVISDALRTRSPQRFRDLQRRASTYYEAEVARVVGEQRQWLTLEALYHAVRADEPDGIRRFQLMAEEAARFQLVARLRTLVTDADTYPLLEDDSRLWRRYYAGRLEHLQGRTAAAERVYEEIGEDGRAESKLRAYALCDLGSIFDDLDRLAEPGGEERARDVVTRSLRLAPGMDAKIASNHVSLMNISNARAKWDESLEHLRDLRAFAERTEDAYELASTDRLQAAVHGLRGDWDDFLAIRRRYAAAVDELGDLPALRMHILYFTWPLTFMGRCREAQASAEQALELAIRLEEKELMVTILESIGLALGMQDEFSAAGERFDEAMNFYDNFYASAGRKSGSTERYIRALLSFRGLVSMRAGRLEQAEADLNRGLEIKRAIGDRIGMVEMHVWRGQLRELWSRWDDARQEYEEAFSYDDLGRTYFRSAALCGIVRIHTAAGRLGEAEAVASEADAIARSHGYHDQLSSLYLSRGHGAWEGSPGAARSRSDAAAAFYREALVHALRHNRFLLDEALSGRSRGSCLLPVVHACAQRGADGAAVLAALREWWRTGTNDLAAGETPAVSPLEPGVPLTAAEQRARAGEPGSGARVPTVEEQLAAAM